MAKKVNTKSILEKGTPKQKALLIIENDEASVRQSGGFLSEYEVQAIYNSVKPGTKEAKEFNKYIGVADKYIINRFRIYGLQENVKKLLARIAGYCNLWEMAEQQAEFCNTILGLIDTEGVKGVTKVSHKADVERYIYQSGKSWSKYVSVKRKKNEDGTLQRDVEVDLSTLKTLLDGVIADYTASMSVAKAFITASEEFIAMYDAEAFVPNDIKEMFSYLAEPKSEVPDIYRRDSYLALVAQKGEEDREVKYRKRYAILPAWEEIEPIGLDNARGAFSL